jgi:AcrR family transcriptional regulator
VDAIVRQSGTARKSFYTHFESKDALVAAALERRDERWMNWFIKNTLRHGKSARTHLLGMFDVLREWFASDDFHGCAFLNASGEIAAPDDPIRVVAREHKERLLAFVREQCDDRNRRRRPACSAPRASVVDPDRRRNRGGAGQRRTRCCTGCARRGRATAER